jgi:hypothetical protein
VSAEELLTWAHFQRNGAQVLTYFGTIFSKSASIENYGNLFKIKTSRDNFSIGYVFGLLEELKEKYSISEYSAAQTSLE